LVRVKNVYNTLKLRSLIVIENEIAQRDWKVLEDIGREINLKIDI